MFCNFLRLGEPSGLSVSIKSEGPARTQTENALVLAHIIIWIFVYSMSKPCSAAVILDRVYFKRGIKPKCGVQNEKCGVQISIWSVDSQENH